MLNDVTSECCVFIRSCQICDYSARTQQNLRLHLRKHTGDTPYVCYVCKSAFRVKSDLTRHMRVHSGEKPFKCQDCTFACSLKS